MLEHIAEEVRGEPVDFSALPDFSQSIGPALEGMRDQYPVLTSAPAIIQESLLFPYIEGASFVAAAWQDVEGRPPPFGEYLPQSSEQILNPERSTLAEEDPPTELDISVSGDWDVVYQNTLGQMELQILLDELLGEGHRALAQGWDGDRFVLLETTENQADGLIWGSVWDSAAQRDLFVSGLQSGLERLPEPATLVAAEIFGRPGAILRVGPGGAAQIEITEGEAR